MLDRIKTDEPRIADILRKVKGHKPDLVEELRKISSEILNDDLWKCFKRSRNSFDKFAGKFLHSKFFSNYSDRFSIQDSNCLKYFGKCFDFCYIENLSSRKLTYIIHKDIAELLGLANDTTECEYTQKIRIRPEYIVKFDDMVAEGTSLYIKPLKEWRQTQKYKTCERALKYLVKRVDEVLWKSSLRNRLPNLNLSLDEGDNIVLKLGDFFTGCISLTRYRVDVNKTLQQIIEEYEQSDLEWRQAEENERLKRQQWIDAISCYVKGEMTDNGDDEDIALFHFEDSCNDHLPLENNVLLLRQVKNNGIAPLLEPWGGKGQGTGLIKEGVQSSAEAFYKEFLDIHQNNSYIGRFPGFEATLTENQDTNGKSLHVSLSVLNFDYSDATRNAIITLKEEYKKYYENVEPFVLHCNRRKKKGVDIIQIFWFNRGTFETLEEVALFEKPIEINEVHKLRYLYDTVRPLLSMKRGQEIGYFNCININKRGEKQIEVSLILCKYLYYDMCDYEITEYFELDENFETNFRSWWKRALLLQVKWLKSEITRMLTREDF